MDIRWGTDLKPEKYLTAERAEILRRAGAVSCALGVESAAPRVLRLIDKGAPVTVVGQVIEHLAAAGIAAEAMCFTDFPSETHAEAAATLEFLRAHEERVALHIVGEFGLTHGSLVARDPSRFDIRETWELDGDELGLDIFFEPARLWKTDEERSDIDARLRDLSRGWVLRTYPWAGAVSTAHPILYYERRGPDVFRELARAERDRRRAAGERAARRVPGCDPGIFEATLRFDPAAAALAQARDASIWATLVGDERRIGRAAYEAQARAMPALRPRPVKLSFALHRRPLRIPGRRADHTPNAARR